MSATAEATTSKTEKTLKAALNDSGMEDAADGTSEEQNERLAVFKKPDPKVRAMVKDGCRKVEEIAEKRKTLSSGKSAVMDGLEEKGFNKEGIAFAMKYMNMSDKRKQAFDLTYRYVRDVLGEPVQDDMFGAAMASEARDRQSNH